MSLLSPVFNLAQCLTLIFDQTPVHNSQDPRICSENEFSGEKSITDARHVGLLGFQSRNGLIEMKSMNGGIARIMLDREFRANHIARIISSDGRIIL